ncbi:unnamed protein product [Caenorhabditis auriculariae]|uniref:Uncharacterized protein n=1 Tax=Caenorhabditis auriculariae TaxID=2777116 RepID=A0A8S1GW27_9PELO|nr:unnamed protein product [Caenorhabditis auriculariae]
MEPGSASQTMAKAKFEFVGSNNDELHFGKDDIIVITQQPDGGWWEGTFNGQTGWFPAAYVTLITEKEKLMRSRSVPNASAKGMEHLKSIELNRQDYRADVLKNFLKYESEYVESLRGTIVNFLHPIMKSEILSAEDFDILAGNFEEIFKVQKSILDELEENVKEEPQKQRIGGILLNAAVGLRKALLRYSENHPKAAEVIKEKFGDLEGVLTKNGKEMKDLISGLSEPFRHIERYQPAMQEMERIVTEGYADRGDLHRSGSVYREIKECCTTIRKQKEAQLEFLYVAKVEKIVPFTERGSILYVGVSSVQVDNKEPSDKFISLFSRYLMFFDITTSMGYELQEKMPTNGLNVTKINNEQVTIERKGTKIVLGNSQQSEIDRWMAAFGKCDGVTTSTNVTALRKPSTTANDNCQEDGALRPVELTPRRRVSKGLEESLNNSGIKFDHDLEMILPEGFFSNEREPRQNAFRAQFLSAYDSPFLLRGCKSCSTQQEGACENAQRSSKR